MEIRLTDVVLEHVGGVRALDGVSLEIPEGQACVVLGLSGAGKSSLEEKRKADAEKNKSEGLARQHGGLARERSNMQMNSFVVDDESLTLVFLYN